MLNSAVDVWFNVCVLEYANMPVLYNKLPFGDIQISKSKSKKSNNKTKVTIAVILTLFKIACLLHGWGCQR